jgi:hypothetical protein
LFVIDRRISKDKTGRIVIKKYYLLNKEVSMIQDRFCLGSFFMGASGMARVHPPGTMVPNEFREILKRIQEESLRFKNGPSSSTPCSCMADNSP